MPSTLKEFLDGIKRFSEGGKAKATGEKAKATAKPHPYAAIQLSRIGRYINGTATHHEIQTIGGKHRGRCLENKKPTTPSVKFPTPNAHPACDTTTRDARASDSAPSGVGIGLAGSEPYQHRAPFQAPFQLKLPNKQKVPALNSTPGVSSHQITSRPHAKTVRASISLSMRGEKSSTNHGTSAAKVLLPAFVTFPAGQGFRRHGAIACASKTRGGASGKHHSWHPSVVYPTSARRSQHRPPKTHPLRSKAGWGY